MWTSRVEELNGGRGLKFAIKLDATPIPYGKVLVHWQEDAKFRTFFLALLADVSFAAFRWETPSLCTSTAGRPFEFVLLDSPELASHPDALAFAEHFQAGATADVIEFPNLRKDAILIVPRPKGPAAAYAHLAAFVRQAPEEQKHALWERVGHAMTRRLGKTPVWLSTAGAGVSWLHVRLDNRPKYYGYAPYR